MNFSGKRCGDNAKIISQSLYCNNNIKQVWLYYNQKFCELPQTIKQVKWGSIAMIYELSTSRVWCTTHTFPSWVKKRKKQYYIQTWHGGLGIKKILLDDPNISKIEKERVIANSRMIDVLISNSDWLTALYKTAFNYHGEILKIGYPKTDYLLNMDDKVKKHVYSYYNLDKDDKILLYAPTMRNNPSKKIFDLKYEGLSKVLKKKFGGNWKIMVRFHPVNESFADNYDFNSEVINATSYPDILELTFACDLFVSDYSSGIFDAALINKKAITFALDEEDYNKERGLYIKLSDLPFPVARNTKELYNIIGNFDEKLYYDDVKSYFSRVGLYDTGNATDKIIDLIEKKMR